MFKKKYDIEKMTFITLTDGSGNYPNVMILSMVKKEIGIKQMFIRLIIKSLLKEVILLLNF